MKIAGFTIKKQRTGTFGGTSPKPGAGRPKKADELKRLESRLAEQTLRNRFALAKARGVALRKGLKGGDVPDEASRDLDIDHLTVAQAKKLGVRLTFGPKNQPIEQDGLKGFLKGFFDEDGGAGLAKLLGMYFGTAVPPSAAGPVPRNGVATQHALPAPSQTTPATQIEPIPEDVTVPDPRNTAIIDTLSGLSPVDAAGQILRFGPIFGLGWLIDSLVVTPDGQRSALFDALDQQQPQGRPLVAWLRGRPEWTAETIAAMRKRRGMGETVATPAGQIGY